MKTTKKILISLSLLISCLSAFGQECEALSIITNQYSGISLGPNCNFMRELGKPFQPSFEQVKKAEQGLHKQLFNKMKEHPNITDKYAIKNPHKYFRKWERQYVGYFDENNQQLIEINLLNFGARKARDKFKGWTKDFFLGLGKYYEENTRRYTFNLTTGELRI